MNLASSTRLLGPTLLTAALFASATLADEIDFEGLAAGTIVSGLNSAGGVGPILVNGFNPSLGGRNAAVIFDSANPTGGDEDLGTPNGDFGGPGVGAGGQAGASGENSQALGMLLIVDENLVTGPGGLVTEPDDTALAGATLELDFSRACEPDTPDGTCPGATVSIGCVDYVDVEPSRAGSIELFDPRDRSLGTFPIAAVGDNGVGRVEIGGVGNVARMLVTFGGSGALSRVQLDLECNATVGDYVWNDLNGDGFQQASEEGLAGVGLELTDADGIPIGGAITDSSGFYSISGLCAGTYTIDIPFPPDGLVRSPCTPDNFCDVIFSVTSNELVTNLDFGFFPEPFAFCDSNPNSTGQASRIDYTGSRSMAANDSRIIITELPPNKPAYLIYGPTRGSGAPFGDGYRCVNPPVRRYTKIPSTGAGGTLNIALDFTQPPLGSGPGQVFPGVAHYFQAWFRDQPSFNTSDGVCVTFAP